MILLVILRFEYLFTTAQHAILTTKTNTRMNASSLSTPRRYSYRPTFSPHRSETRIKFVTNHEKEVRNNTKADPPPMSMLRSSPVQPTQLPRSIPISAPITSSPLKSKTPTRTPLTKSKKLPRSVKISLPPNSMAQVAATDTGHQTNPPPILQRVPTSSTGSLYSTRSGEERQARAPTNSILATIDQIGHTLDGRRIAALTRSPGSVYSTTEEHPPHSGWKSFLRPLSSTSNNAQPSRLSHASSGSMYSQPEDQSGVPIGFAYGGE